MEVVKKVLQAAASYIGGPVITILWPLISTSPIIMLIVALGYLVYKTYKNPVNVEQVIYEEAIVANHVAPYVIPAPNVMEDDVYIVVDAENQNIDVPEIPNDQICQEIYIPYKTDQYLEARNARNTTTSKADRAGHHILCEIARSMATAMI